MNKTHPSRWKIRRKNHEKHCQIILLPLGKDTRSFEVSTKFLSRVYKEWDGQAKTDYAGDFATALRELRAHKIELRGMPQISNKAVDAAYAWLSEYEMKLSQYRIDRQETVKEELVEMNAKYSGTSQPAAAEPKQSRCAKYGTVMHIAIAEYIKLAGPMGCAKQIIEKAKAVADAYEEVENAK
jgi:hypothetical protein